MTITWAPIATRGYQSLTLSYDRVTAGLGSLSSDSGIVEYAADGGTFTIPGSPGTVTLRFRVNALGTGESFSVNNIVLSGTPGSTGGTSSARPALGNFVTFESGHVRPMVLSGDGQRLYVVNTPDNRVEVYDVSGNTPTWRESIPVGLEPVALALAPNGQLWVVDHLSDSVSVIDASASPARVVNTLLVGDGPRDIVFAGPSDRWAFITAAHRGQNVKFDPQLIKPSTGRADVWVFNVASPGTALGGTPVTVLNMFGDTLRGLARNADGSRVYAAVLNSGNKTTVVEGSPLGGALDKAPPTKAADGTAQPNTGLIVQKNANGDWVDSGDPKTGTAA
jgi:YVTN family beta-propeller protein